MKYPSMPKPSNASKKNELIKVVKPKFVNSTKQVTKFTVGINRTKN